MYKGKEKLIQNSRK